MNMIYMEPIEHENAVRYIERPAERLVVTGYRRWLYTMVHEDMSHIDDLFNAYQSLLGQQVARDALRCLVRALHQLKSNPCRSLNFLAPDCCHLCCDERMVLNLIAAIQHGDDRGLKSSLDGLIGVSEDEEEEQSRRLNIMRSISEFALLLKVSGLILLPIPFMDLEHLSDHTYGHTYFDQFKKTITYH